MVASTRSPDLDLRWPASYVTGRLRMSRRAGSDPAHRAQTSSYAARVWLQHRLGHLDRTSADPRTIGSRPPTRGRVLRDRHHRTRREQLRRVRPQRRHLGTPPARAAGDGVRPGRQGHVQDAQGRPRPGHLGRPRGLAPAGAGAAPRPERRRGRRAAGAPRPRAADAGARSSTSTATPPRADAGRAPQRRRAAPPRRGDALAGLEAALDAKLAPVEQRDDRAARAADAVGGVTGERRSRRAGRGAGAPQGDEARPRAEQRPAGTASRPRQQGDRQQGQQRDGQQRRPPAGQPPAGRHASRAAPSSRAPSSAATATRTASTSAAVAVAGRATATGTATVTARAAAPAVVPAPASSRASTTSRSPTTTSCSPSRASST